MNFTKRYWKKLLTFRHNDNLNIIYFTCFNSICIEILLLHHPDLRSFSLTFQHSVIINIDWTRLFQIIHQRDSDVLLSFLSSFSNLKKMKIKVNCLTEMWSVWILQMSQKCRSLTVLMWETSEISSVLFLCEFVCSWELSI